MGDEARAKPNGDSDKPLFRYTDEHGTPVIVDRLALVPADRLDDVDVISPAALPPAAREAPSGTGSAGVDVPSFAAGLGLGVLLTVALALLRRPSRLLRLAAIVAVVVGIALAYSAYAGFSLRSAGLGDGSFADPRRALDEARAAQQKANAVREAQERALRAVDGDSAGGGAR